MAQLALQFSNLANGLWLLPVMDQIRLLGRNQAEFGEIGADELRASCRSTGQRSLVD
ncbi:MAG: hypothetical protein WCA35_16760 [Kovacikia sp.]